MNRDEVLDVLSQFKRERAQTYGILAIGVFGSIARNQAGEASDVDICVKSQTPNPFALVHIKEEIEGRIHRPVDIVRVREKMNPFLKSRIEEEGVYV